MTATTVCSSRRHVMTWRACRETFSRWKHWLNSTYRTTSLERYRRQSVRWCHFDSLMSPTTKSCSSPR